MALFDIYYSVKISVIYISYNKFTFLHCYALL